MNMCIRKRDSGTSFADKRSPVNSRSVPQINPQIRNFTKFCLRHSHSDLRWSLANEFPPFHPRYLFLL